MVCTHCARPRVYGRKDVSPHTCMYCKPYLHKPSNCWLRNLLRMPLREVTCAQYHNSANTGKCTIPVRWENSVQYMYHAQNCFQMTSWWATAWTFHIFWSYIYKHWCAFFNRDKHHQLKDLITVIYNHVVYSHSTTSSFIYSRLARSYRLLSTCALTSLSEACMTTAWCAAVRCRFHWVFHRDTNLQLFPRVSNRQHECLASN